MIQIGLGNGRGADGPLSIENNAARFPCWCCRLNRIDGECNLRSIILRACDFFVFGKNRR